MDLLILNYLGWGAVSLLALWIMFINAMFLMKHKEKIEKYKIIYYPLLFVVAIGFLFDVFFNVVWGTLIFWEKPDWVGANGKLHFNKVNITLHFPTLSERLADILAGRRNAPVRGKRWYLAKFMCHCLIEPWDYNHCGLENIKEIHNKVFKK